MRSLITTAMAALMAVTSFATVSVSSADAQPRFWRHGHHGKYADPRYSRGPGYSSGHRYDPGHRYSWDNRYYHRRHNSGVGAAVVGGIVGLAAGSMIAGSMRSGESVAYCEQRFRSYDRSTGTYLGYDGLRHACP